MSEVEHLLAVRNHLGEGPVWHPVENALYWVDIRENHIHRFVPSTGKQDRFDVPMAVTAMGLRDQGGWVVSTRDGFAFWEPDGGITPIAEPEARSSETRFNDGAVDPLGRFWAGTMNDVHPRRPDGCLYRLDADRSVRIVERDFTICNGIGWSPDHRTMYFTDTLRSVILAYDFDPSTGDLANRRPFVEVPREQGFPDGLAVDSEGCVWSAHWGTGKLRRYGPGGRAEREIRFPVTNVSSCAFGGDFLDELYVTTAWEHLGEAERRSQPLAGDLFRIHVGVRGLTTHRFRG